MLHGTAALFIGVLTVMIAIGSLGFTFWSIIDYSERCETEQFDICNALAGPSFPLIIIILIIAGLILVSSTVVYILITAQ